MLPVDLKHSNITLPPSDHHRIVIITNSKLRHQRYALRLQQEFGEKVVAWYQMDPSAKPVWASSLAGAKADPPQTRLLRLTSKARGYFKENGFVPTLLRMQSEIYKKFYDRKFYLLSLNAEKDL